MSNIHLSWASNQEKKLFPKLFPSTTGGSRSASHRAYPSGSRIESTSRRYHRGIIPLSFFMRREGSDTDDESTKAIAHARWLWCLWKRAGERSNRLYLYVWTGLGEKEEKKDYYKRGHQTSTRTTTSATNLMYTKTYAELEQANQPTFKLSNWTCTPSISPRA